MVLINISNHPSEKWSEEQKSQFTEIVDLPFPNIDPESPTIEVSKQVKSLISKVIPLAEEKGTTNICLLGEYSFCYMFIRQLLDESSYYWYFWVPTTKRVVEEITTPEGVQKTSVFKFVSWRTIIF